MKSNYRKVIDRVYEENKKEFRKIRIQEGWRNKNFMYLASVIVPYDNWLGHSLTFLLKTLISFLGSLLNTLGWTFLIFFLLRISGIPSLEELPLIVFQFLFEY